MARRLALLGGLMQPTRGEDIVSRNAEAILIHIAEISLGDRRPPLGRNQEKRRGADIVLALKGALAGAERVGFCTGGKAQSRKRQSRGKPADGVDKPPAVARASIIIRRLTPVDHQARDNGEHIINALCRRSEIRRKAK